MKELETLLTSLVQRGWKPWGAENVDSIFCLDYKPALTCLGEDSYPIITLSNCSFRELVSLESGLWQFVCRYKLYKKTNEKFRESVSKVSLNT